MARRKLPRRGFRRGQQEGGLLVGPSHEQGGIGAVISGGEQVELEGGEYIINAQTVDALGVPFLDKIKNKKFKKQNIGAKEAEDFLKNFSKEKK